MCGRASVGSSLRMETMSGNDATLTGDRSVGRLKW